MVVNALTQSFFSVENMQIIIESAQIYSDKSVTWSYTLQSLVFFLIFPCLAVLLLYLLHANNVQCVLNFSRRRTSLGWWRSCQRRALMRAAIICLTPKAQKTVVPSLKRAGEEGGCEEVQCNAVGFNHVSFKSLHHYKLLLSECWQTVVSKGCFFVVGFFLSFFFLFLHQQLFIMAHIFGSCSKLDIEI